MRKQELISKVYEHEEVQHVSILYMRRVIDSFLQHIMEALLEGRTLEIRNFGVFKLVTRKKKIAQNIRKRQAMVLPERKELVFKPGKHFKKRLKELYYGI